MDKISIRPNELTTRFMANSFRERTCCPGCQRSTVTVLKDIQFTDAVVFDFLNQYYEGRIFREVISGTNFVVSQCQSCSLVFQKWILTDPYLKELYDTWIPEGDSYRKKKETDFALYNRYAKEVRQILPHFSGQRPFEIYMLDFGRGGTSGH